MAKIKSFEELKKIREQVINRVDIREKGDHIESLVEVRVAMATCGIAAGARTVMNTFIDEIAKQGLNNVVVTQTGCMGYCYAEPTVEVRVPDKEPIVFGEVDGEKVEAIIEKYIKNGILLDGIIPVTHKGIED
ncbi:MAG: (2Fe-2S) ferredoxin domain-containing protein [Epulopiscium sp.]|nr:(2Fe-2S) ferredoxin domain-containing protein [Candidatus Epulonipiscium sp.]